MNIDSIIDEHAEKSKRKIIKAIEEDKGEDANNHAVHDTNPKNILAPVDNRSPRISTHNQRYITKEKI